MTTPQDWQGSLPELIVFQELLRRGLEPGLDFIYQSPMFGGRAEKGGAVLDFYFINPPQLAVNVQGEYYHYRQGLAYIAADRLLKAQMAGQGITLVFIDESDVLKDVKYYVGEALNYKDHSRLG